MEESEDANPVKKKHPSLPENYVTIAMLKERWLQRKKQEEEEENLKLQRNPKPDQLEENPNYVTLSMLKEQAEEVELNPPDPINGNPNGSKPGTKPPIRNRNRRMDRRGCVKEYEEGPDSINSVANRGIRAEKTKSGFRERRKPRVLGNVKLQANVAAQVVASQEENGGGKEGGSELQLAGNGADKASSGGSRGGRKKWKRQFKRNEGRMKVQQQGEEGLRENGNKDGDGFVGLAKDTTPPAVKIDERLKDLSLNDPKNAIVKKRATKIKDQLGSMQCEKMAEEERRFRGGRKDRVRISSGGGGGGGWRKMEHRRASSTRVGGDQLVWVKKGETLGGCVTTGFNSQVHI